MSPGWKPNIKGSSTTTSSWPLNSPISRSGIALKSDREAKSEAKEAGSSSARSTSIPRVAIETVCEIRPDTTLSNSDIAINSGSISFNDNSISDNVTDNSNNSNLM